MINISSKFYLYNLCCNLHQKAHFVPLVLRGFLFSSLIHLCQIPPSWYHSAIICFFFGICFFWRSFILFWLQAALSNMNSGTLCGWLVYVFVCVCERGAHVPKITASKGGKDGINNPPSCTWRSVDLESILLFVASRYFTSPRNSVATKLFHSFCSRKRQIEPQTRV